MIMLISFVFIFPFIILILKIFIMSVAKLVNFILAIFIYVLLVIIRKNKIIIA